MMTAQNFETNDIRIPVIPGGGPTLGLFSNPLAPMPDKPRLINIFPYSVNGDPEHIAKEALKRDLSEVEKIRFDTVANVCNSACIFCYSKMEGDLIQISPKTLEKLLKRIYLTCRRVVIGCGYEPLLASNFVEYSKVICKVIESNFVKLPVVSLTTNGLLLNKKNLEYLLPVLNWIHISVPSHRKDHYENIMTKAHFENMYAGILHVREKYPSIRIHLEMVLNKINLLDVEDYLNWAFENMGIDTINIRRVNTIMGYHPASNLAKTLANGLDISLTDVEWSNVVERTKKWKPNITNVYNGDNNYLVSILEFSKSTDR